MATEVITKMVDDLDGYSEADGSVRFSLDGRDYAIDLSSKNAEELRRVLDLYVRSARRVGGRRASSTIPSQRPGAPSRPAATVGAANPPSLPTQQPSPATPPTPSPATPPKPKTTVDKAQQRHIREWAREQGYNVSDRGRISAKVMEAWHEAHPPRKRRR